MKISSNNNNQPINQNQNQPDLNSIMKDIENKTEAKLMEGYKTEKISLSALLTNPTSPTTPTQINKAKESMVFLESIMQEGANEFKKKTGRNMTYSEMREMYG